MFLRLRLRLTFNVYVIGRTEAKGRMVGWDGVASTGWAFNEYTTYIVIVVLYTIPCLTSLTVDVRKDRGQGYDGWWGWDGVVSTGWAGG